MDRTIEILRKLVSIDSTNLPGNEMDIVKEILEFFPKDIKSKVVDHGNNRGSLVIEIDGDDKEKIGFIGHLDTVPVTDESNWIHPPFEGVIENGYMYGRGTCDMKGGVTAMIKTALHFIENEITPLKSLKFVFTADEESGGLGVCTLRDKGLLNDISKVFITEPSNEEIGICEKGTLWLNINIKGKASHASKPELGINSIEKLFEYVSRLKNTLDLEKTHPLLGNSTFSITTISGGVKTNIIPEDVKATIDIRTIPGINHEELINNAIIIAKDMELENQGMRIYLEVDNNRPPLSMERDNDFINEIVEVYNKLSIPLNFKGINFYTDASQLIPYHNIPFVILGPGDENICHQKDERIKLESIEKMTEFYISYIMN